MLPQWPACAALLCICIMSTCALHCPWRQFKLPSMKSCHPWLQCDAMAELPIGDLLGFGAVKKLYESEWKRTPVALAFLNNPDYREDFHAGLNNLKALAVYPGIVVQLIGFCEDSNVYVTELQPFRDATNFNRFLQTFSFHGIGEEMRTRFRFCMKYVKILVTLHAFPPGAMVMCDSNSLEKTLHQYLLSEEHLLLLGDTDALPVVLKKHAQQKAERIQGDEPYSYSCQCEDVCWNPVSSKRAFRYFFMCYSKRSKCVCKPDASSDGEDALPVPGLSLAVAATGEYSAVLEAIPRGEGGIRCGTKLLTGDFVAPEQRHGEAFLSSCRVGNVPDGEGRICEVAQATTPGSPVMDIKSKQLVYDEATDVFKIPTVCEYFLGEGRKADEIKRRLSGIHVKCNSDIPGNRPSAEQVLQAYKNLSARLYDLF